MFESFCSQLRKCFQIISLSFCPPPAPLSALTPHATSCCQLPVIRRGLFATQSPTNLGCVVCGSPYWALLLTLSTSQRFVKGPKYAPATRPPHAVPCTWNWHDVQHALFFVSLRSLVAEIWQNCDRSHMRLLRSRVPGKGRKFRSPFGTGKQNHAFRCIFMQFGGNTATVREPSGAGQFWPDNFYPHKSSPSLLSTRLGTALILRFMIVWPRKWSSGCNQHTSAAFAPGRALTKSGLWSIGNPP